MTGRRVFASLSSHRIFAIAGLILPKLPFLLALAPGIFAGCATSVTPAAAPLVSAEKSATEYEQRSLRDPDLHRFLAANAGRDPGEAWDFETLCWTAFYFNPALDVARAQWSSARAAQEVAGVRPNPTLTLTPGYNFTREAGVSPWMPGLGLDFLLPTTTKRERQIAVARHEAEAARLQVFGAAWQVRSDLRRALADVAWARRREAQLAATAEAQRGVLSLLEQRLAAGAIGATEVSLARAAQLRAEFAAAEAKGQGLLARARVAAALSVPVSALDGVALPGPASIATLSPEALTTARSQALRARPDVQAALARYHAAHASLELEVARRVPEFHLGPGYQWDQGMNKWTLGLSFELPIFHRNEAAIAAAVARRAEAAAQFTQVQAQAIAAIELAVAGQAAAEVQLASARRWRAEAEQQRVRAEQRVAAGGADQLELQNTRIEITTADAVVNEAENAFALAAGQLEDALHVPLPALALLTARSTSSARLHD